MKIEPLQVPVSMRNSANVVRKLAEMINKEFRIPPELLRETRRHYTTTELYKEAKQSEVKPALPGKG